MGVTASSNMNYAFSYMDIQSEDILTSNGNKVFSVAKHDTRAKSDQKNKVELVNVLPKPVVFILHSRFAHFPKLNKVLSNASLAEHRR